MPSVRQASDPIFLLYLVPPGQPTDYPSSFWRDFRDCNVGMYISNNALVPDPGDRAGCQTDEQTNTMDVYAGRN